VHVLTLTATPIPRTLQAALVGLQELSVITTPPSRRRPIRTFNTPFDPVAVRGALLREQRRGGQSFVVVPRIEDMEPMAARLRELAPELTIFAAHGKMPAADVDDVMVRFANGDGDVLLATNIIESGLDVPRANTMVISRADLFGLAQLHQLRGRVGRGRVQGVCYLQTDPDHPLSEQAAKRLGALEAFDRLGAGLAISAQDLDIRGAGDLLGDEQKGHVKLVGLELHQHLLGLAIRQARGEEVEDWTPELNVGSAGELPPEYIPEVDIRLGLYTRLAKALEPADVDHLGEEIEDRFGPPPPAARDLLAATNLRTRCRQLGIARIDAGPKAIALTFRHAEALTAHADVVERTSALNVSGERLVLSAPSDTAEQRLELVLALLDELA
jgi:transcription-repair coupling factor (superfamily II helicase)